MPVWPNKSEVVERRAEWEAGTPMFKHDGCSIAFPENNFERNFSLHLTAHRLSKAGQPPTPVTKASQYCRSMTALLAAFWAQFGGYYGLTWLHLASAALSSSLWGFEMGCLSV